MLDKLQIHSFKLFSAFDYLFSTQAQKPEAKFDLTNRRKKLSSKEMHTPIRGQAEKFGSYMVNNKLNWN